MAAKAGTMSRLVAMRDEHLDGSLGVFEVPQALPIEQAHIDVATVGRTCREHAALLDQAQRPPREAGVAPSSHAHCPQGRPVGNDDGMSRRSFHGDTLSCRNGFGRDAAILCRLWSILSVSGIYLRKCLKRGKIWGRWLQDLGEPSKSAATALWLLEAFCPGVASMRREVPTGRRARRPSPLPHGVAPHASCALYV